MSTMKSNESPPAIAPEVSAELDGAVADIIAGRRDPEAMRQAAERMDRMREDLRREGGETDLAAELTDPDDDE